MNSPFVYVCQHHPAEPPGTLGDVLRERHVETRVVQSFAGEPVPAAMGDAAGLILMGGPMGALEGKRYPFLWDEIALIRDALEHNLPVLGICLGAQMLAHVLGASVFKCSRPEIGWHPLTLTDAAAHDPLWAEVPSPCIAFHWHDDCFTLPPGATALASTEVTPCQAFRWGANVYGLQCHLEVNAAIVHDWLGLWGDALPPNAAQILVQQSCDLLPALTQTARAIFTAWAHAASL